MELFDHYKITPELRDERNGGIPIEANFSGLCLPSRKPPPRPCFRKRPGCCRRPPAFGKTVVALWLIAERKVNTLVLVHRSSSWINGGAHRSILGIPKRKSGVTAAVSTNAMEARCGGAPKRRPQGRSRRLGQGIWADHHDECHHISAFSFEQVIRSATAKYKHGLSATLTRKDGQHPIVFMNLGRFGTP